MHMGWVTLSHTNTYSKLCVKIEVSTSYESSNKDVLCPFPQDMPMS